MPLSCPRCPAGVLAERLVTPSGGGAPVDVYLCATCNGVWLDGPTLTSICPTLSHLPQHRDEVALLGGQGKGIPLCLRCGVAPFEYQVIGVAIDFCLRCHGVWLDGDEYEEALLTAAEAPAAGRGGPYRRAANTLTTGEVKCAYCGELVPPKKAYVRERGAACTRCHFAAEQRRAERRAADSWTEGPPSGHDVAHSVRDSGLLEDLEASARALLGWSRR
jgi:Zn-finger nucleic acid-binding protein